MDENRLRKMYQRLLDDSYNDRMDITEFRTLPTSVYDNEKGEWVPDSYSICITLRDKNPESMRELGVCNLLEGTFGFECILDFA